MVMRKHGGVAMVAAGMALLSVEGGAARPARADGNGARYKVNRLVSDDTSVVPAEHQDPDLKNAWGLAAGPSTFWWVADNATSLSTLYDAEGNKQQLVVTVPGAPSGLVFNPGSGFPVTDGTNTGPARFIFASEDGTISAWSPTVPPPAPSHQAFVTIDDSDEGAVYKGLAITPTGDRLYATDFHNDRIEVYGADWKDVDLPEGAFTDPALPPHYAPFGIRDLDGMIIVTYALQDADAHDDVAGHGHGFVDAYSPWGLALAPPEFGHFGGDLLVGNFGDGQINAFDLGHCERTHCNSHGTLIDAAGGGPITIDGLWSIDFGKGNSMTGDTDELYFTAGPNDEQDGLFGYIEPLD